ncbi:hypothetical protein EST38_g12917, partial [Candolleomyces aberdarensis]
MEADASTDNLVLSPAQPSNVLPLLPPLPLTTISVDAANGAGAAVETPALPEPTTEPKTRNQKKKATSQPASPST